jgi:ParB family chromosome partitioning protein
MTSSATKKRGLPGRVKMRHDTHFVEALTTRHDVPVGKMVSLSSIEPDPNQPRTVMGDLEDLVRSIRDRGILEPILVRPIGNEAGEAEGAESYRIISGERRYRAAQQAGLFEVPVIEMDVGEKEALEIALIENLQRKDLTPFEEAEGYKALAERYDYTHEEISDAVGKGRTVITESLSLLQMPARVRDTVQALGIQSKSLLLEVLKAGSEEEMIRLLEEVSSHGLNRDDLRRRLRNRDRAGSRSSRRTPYSFKFKAPDKSYTLNLTFRQSEVEKQDLIQALEQILTELRSPEA